MELSTSLLYHWEIPSIAEWMREHLKESEFVAKAIVLVKAPINSGTVERSFHSVQKSVGKDQLRIGDDTLEGMALLSFNKDITGSLDKIKQF